MVFVQPQRIKSDEVLLDRIRARHCSKSSRSAWREQIRSSRHSPGVDHETRRTLRVGSALIGSREQSAQHALGRDRISSRHIRGCRPACSRNTATTDGRGTPLTMIRMADLLGAQFLTPPVPKPRKASTLPSMKSCIGLASASMTQSMSRSGSRPTCSSPSRPRTDRRGSDFRFWPDTRYACLSGRGRWCMPSRANSS